MDLDNIKKRWQEAEMKSTIDEDKIRKMISNEGQSAFGKLLWYERLGLWLSIPCLSFLLIVTWHVYIVVFLMASFIAVLSIVWQMYKLNYLKRLDMMNMNILEISSHVNKYKIYINREMIVGVIIFFVFFAFYIYYTSNNHDYAPDTMKYMLIRFVITVGVGLMVALLLYRHIYLKNIEKLQASIKEIEEFEKDNQE